MIPLSIEEPDVLRRTLEEMEASIPKLDQSAKTVNILEDGSDLATVTKKVNELIGTVNLIVSALNSTD